MDDKLTAKTAKFTSLENLYIYIYSMHLCVYFKHNRVSVCILCVYIYVCTYCRLFVYVLLRNGFSMQIYTCI